MFYELVKDGSSIQRRAVSEGAIEYLYNFAKENYTSTHQLNSLQSVKKGLSEDNRSVVGIDYNDFSEIVISKRF